MDKKLAVVAIPVYKESLEWWEKVSLVQVQRVLGQYDICFFAPQSLHIPYAGKGIRVERFDDACFRDRDAYSRLMLSTDFYERFSDYEYLLLYQLDAFVFSDRLAAFCAMGYDYIGAPVKRYDANWKDFGCFVGNGGLSLRKISSTLRVLQQKERIFAMRPKNWKENRFLIWEDLFFAFCSTIPSLDFHVPNVRTALTFSVSEDVGHMHQKMPEEMPFGCHAWERLDYWSWKPLIERCGYRLPEPQGASAVHWRRRIVEQYVLRRILREKGRHSTAALQAMKDFLPEERSIVLWGGGTYGKLALSLCRAVGREPVACFDKKADARRGIGQVPMVLPDMDRIRREHLFVFITTLKYEDEIQMDLSKHGCREGEDYICMSDVMHEIFRRYAKSFRERMV